MDDLNYHHLRYFWMAAREGSIVAASRRLGVSHPTISAQIDLLERDLGVALFERKGRGIALTDAGRAAFKYAEAIFGLGQQLVEELESGRQPAELWLRVGVIDVLPKSLVYELLAPAFRLGRSLRLTVHENRSLAQFIGDLATHEIDLVFSDQPLAERREIRLYDRLFGESETVLMAEPGLAERLRPEFPKSLDGQPACLPTAASALRRELDRWLAERGVRPRVVVEVDDSSLLKTFAEGGLGFCAIPRAIQEEAGRRYGLVEIGAAQVPQQVWAISADRLEAHPAIVAIQNAARDHLASATARTRSPNAGPLA